MKKLILMTLVGLLMVFQSCGNDDDTATTANTSFTIENIAVANDGLTGELLTSKVKVVPQENAPSTNYKIKFISYDGATTSKIYFGENEVTLNQSYSIPILNEIVFKTLSFTNGNKTLKFVIFNDNEEVEYILNQSITEKSIGFDNITINTNVAKDNNLIFKSQIIKTPTTDNNTIFYKTWISNSANSQVIDTTNGNWVEYTLVNDYLVLQMPTHLLGEYTLNIQVKDELGNESEVKQYPIVIENAVFDGTPNFNITFEDKTVYYVYNKFFVKSVDGDFTALSNDNNKIDKIEYIIDYDVNYTFPTTTAPTIFNEHKSVTILDDIDLTSTYEANSTYTNTNNTQEISYLNSENFEYSNIELKVKIYLENGVYTEKEITDFDYEIVNE